MNPRLIANQAVNSFRSMGRDVRSTFTGDGKDLTYAFRTSTKQERLMTNFH